MTLKDGIKDYIAKNGLQAKCDERKITIDNISDYVTSQARKALDGNNGAIDDTTVFNWIVHYIEDEYKNKKESKPVVEAKLEPVKEEVKPVTVDPRPKEQEFEQLNLFELANK